MGGGFNVSASTGPLASFLNTSYSSGVFSALGGSTSASTTATALKTGGLTTTQHNAISSIAAAGTGGESIQWNKDGTEPTTLQNLRSYGWAKLTKKSTVDGVTSGVYTLTAVGKAIYARTGGGSVVNGSGAAGTVSDATKQQVTAALASVQNILASLGSSSSSSTTGNGISTANNATTLNILDGNSTASNASAVNILA